MSEKQFSSEQALQIAQAVRQIILPRGALLLDPMVGEPVGQLIPVQTVNQVPMLTTQGPSWSCDSFEMGTLLGHHIPFDLTDEHLATHSCVLGSTGSGKSKFLELLMRQLIASNRGFALIDPHGDLSEDLLAFAGYWKLKTKDRSLTDRIHYLEPSFEEVFSYDPFRFRPTTPIAEHLKNNAYSAWLRAKVDRVAQIFQRKQNQASFEGMPRLQRVLTDVLVVAGTNVNGEPDHHLPLGDVMLLLDFKHKRHAEVYGKIRPRLEPEIAADFDRLASYHSEEQRLRETESTINRLRSLFSPIMKAIFSQQVESIDFRSIIQNGEILLINLRETDYFSADQRLALGGLFINELLTTAQNEERETRKPFHLIIDEAADFIGEDIQHALGVMRKFRLSMCLAAQNLESFKKGELDLRPKVLSQCGTRITFQQSWSDDLEILARVLALGNVDFAKHYQVVDRPDGYDWVDVIERSESNSTGATWGTSNGISSGTTKGTSTAQGHSNTIGESRTYGSSDTRSETRSIGAGTSTGHSHGRSTNHIGQESRSESDSQSNSKSEGSSEGKSQTTSNSRADSSSRSDSVTNTNSESTTEGRSESKSIGGSKSTSESTSYKKVPLARHRSHIQESPSLRYLVSDQLERIKQTIHTLGVGEAVVKLRAEAKAIIIQTAHVDEKWGKKEKFLAIKRMKELCREKPYFCVPNFSPEAAEARISEFAGQKQEIPPLKENRGGHPFPT